MASKRRYRIGINPTYDSTFDRERVNSVILNDRAKADDLKFSMIDYSSKHDMEFLLLQWQGGEEDGKYEYDGVLRMGIVPDIKQKLEENKAKFEGLKQQVINTGKPQPIEPKELAEERLMLEGKLDCALEELEEIKKRLEEVEEVQVEIDDSKLLKYGVRGMSKLLGGYLHTADGQRCEKVNGRILIVDEKSPYCGMEAAMYFQHVSHPWNLVKHKLDRAKKKLFLKLSAKGLTDEFALRWKELHKNLMEQNPNWQKLFSLKFKNKGLPEWPSNVRNWLKEEDKKDGETKQRTKKQEKVSTG